MEHSNHYSKELLEKKLDYPNGVKFMKEFDRIHRGTTLKLCVYPDMVIQYPGSKKPGDYIFFSFNKRTKQLWQPAHSDICRFLYRLGSKSGSHCARLIKLLSHTYRFGTSKPFADPDLKKLQYLLFWMTLQEEINYPQASGFKGILMPYCRYFEAVCCCNPDHGITLPEVLNRCNSGSIPALYPIPHAPIFYA